MAKRSDVPAIVPMQQEKMHWEEPYALALGVEATLRAVKDGTKMVWWQGERTNEEVIQILTGNGRVTLEESIGKLCVPK